jgi:transcriptional regulator with XRE-family HTH domain
MSKGKNGLELVGSCRRLAGEVLRQVREEKGLSQKVLAQKLGCSRPNVTQSEATVDQIGVIVYHCHALGVSLDYFFSLLAEKVGKVEEIALDLPKTEGENLKKVTSQIRRETAIVCQQNGLRADITVKVDLPESRSCPVASVWLRGARLTGRCEQTKAIHFLYDCRGRRLLNLGGGSDFLRAENQD